MYEIVQVERFEALGVTVGKKHRLTTPHFSRNELDEQMNPRQGFLRTSLEQILNGIDDFQKKAPREAFFIMEIGKCLYTEVSVLGDDQFKDREALANAFMKHFMKGYLSENEIDCDLLMEIGLFLRLEEWKAHNGIYQTWDMTQMTQWQCDFFEQTKSRIIHKIPIVAYRKAWGGKTDELSTPIVTVKLQPNFALLFVS